MEYTSRGLRRRRNTDKWEVVLSHKDALTGKPVSTYHTVTAKTAKQAARKRDELILELERKGSAHVSGITVNELVDDLLTHKESTGSIEQSTAYHYRKDARVIARYIGTMRVADLHIPDVEKWLAKMVDDGLAPRTIAKPFRLLSQAMKYAMARDLVTKNPCEFCKLPKIQRKKVDALSRSERTRMLELAQNYLGKPLHLAIVLALTTGMRREEICGLRWSDLNDDGTITVSRAIGVRQGGCYIKDPKTKESFRTIPLADWLYSYLKTLHANCQWEAQSLGAPFGDPYILGTQEPESKFYQPNRLTREFKTFCDTHGFKCSFHDLRHTFASMLIAENADVRTVAGYLGHANVAETLNTYAEVDPDAKKALLDKIQGSFDETRPLPTEKPHRSAKAPAYSIAELEAMLAEARKRESGAA